MTVSTLDPKTALIVVDLQKGIVTFPTAHPIAGGHQAGGRPDRGLP